MLGKILIIDDEEDIRFSLRGILEDEGYEIIEAENAEEGLLLVDSATPDLVFLDIWLPGMDGLAALNRLRSTHTSLPVVMISGHGTIETAVNAIRQGAYDFIEKPLSLDKVLIIASRALETNTLRKENERLRTALPKDNQLVGKSPAMLDFLHLLHKVAPTDAWVLLTGENGTGKELAARTLHAESRRATGPMIAVNCAAIPEELIESELFGHEKGAFTGAEHARAGRFEMAHKGTLFLDEIGDMSLRTQAKILRILQEQCFERIGSTRTIRVDVRVIAATNKNLEEAILAGTFRNDLYYRLRVVPLHIPPLRERDGDVQLLLKAIAERTQTLYTNAVPQYTEAALIALNLYSWPGNVRELCNFAERMAILYGNRKVDVQDLPVEMQKEITKEAFPSTHANCNMIELMNLDYKTARSEFENLYLAHRLRLCAGNITRLAETVGLERSYLHRKLKRSGLQADNPLSETEFDNEH